MAWRMGFCGITVEAVPRKRGVIKPERSLYLAEGPSCILYLLWGSNIRLWKNVTTSACNMRVRIPVEGSFPRPQTQWGWRDIAGRLLRFQVRTEDLAFRFGLRKDKQLLCFTVCFKIRQGLTISHKDTIFVDYTSQVWQDTVTFGSHVDVPSDWGMCDP